MYNGPHIVTDGLVLALDAANTKSYTSGSLTWYDKSGNGNNGTFTASYSFDYGSNGSITFDGISGSFFTSTIVTYGNNTTWEAWINRNTSMPNGYNMFMGRLLPYFAFRPDNTMFFSNSIGGLQKTIITPVLSITNNMWIHTAFTTQFDGTYTTMSVFINSNFVTSSIYSGSQGNSSQPFVIGDGCINPHPWYPFNGKVSNVRVYNKTLSTSEIVQNYNSTKARFGL